MLRTFALAAAMALPAGCTTPAPATTSGTAGFGETVTVGALAVTPIALLEDSRCPQAVRCVWQGRVRIQARVEGTTVGLTMAQPVPVADGALLLADVEPPARPETTIAPEAYRFSFRFVPAR